MNPILNIASCFWLFLLWIPSLGDAQRPFDPEYQSAGSSITDHLEVFTDRTLYVSGETIRFRTDCFTEGLSVNAPWSSVLYAELLAPAGNTVATVKSARQEGFFKGSLSIPDDLLTGHYLMRSYTRWMRNRGPGSYSYTLVKIINPFRREVAEYPGSTKKDSAEINLPMRDTSQKLIECVPEHSVYFPGDWVRISLEVPEDAAPDGFRGCLTVVPDGSADTLTGSCPPGNRSEFSEPFRLQFLPDLGEALSLSGMVVTGKGAPAGGSNLSFSLLGNHPDLITASTDLHGRFAVQVPFSKSDQAFLVAPHPGEYDSLEVRIVQDMDIRRIPFATGRFRLTAQEQEVATRMALQWQIMDAYRDRDSAGITGQVPLNQTLPFYGSAVERIDLSEYVNLPTLEEVFINLVPDVQIVRRKRSLSFYIEGMNSNIGFYRPLVMVDCIPIFDHEALLALNPREFERIEVIREVYVKGSMAFGGVISLFSKNGDMAGLGLSQGSYFFDVIPLPVTPAAGTMLPRIKEIEERPSGDPSVDEPDERLPDLSNTVLWEPDLYLSPGARREITFRAPGGSGSYVVLVRGALSHGKILTGITRFRVQLPDGSWKTPSTHSPRKTPSTGDSRQMP